jgi:hypothetical protein
VAQILFKWALALVVFVLLVFKLVLGTHSLVLSLNAPMPLTVLVDILWLTADALVLGTLLRLSGQALIS